MNSVYICYTNTLLFEKYVRRSSFLTKQQDIRLKRYYGRTPLLAFFKALNLWVNI